MLRVRTWTACLLRRRALGPVVLAALAASLALLVVHEANEDVLPSVLAACATLAAAGAALGLGAARATARAFPRAARRLAPVQAGPARTCAARPAVYPLRL